jgi:hypothetical protein
MVSERTRTATERLSAPYRAYVDGLTPRLPAALLSIASDHPSEDLGCCAVARGQCVSPDRGLGTRSARSAGMLPGWSRGLRAISVCALGDPYTYTATATGSGREQISRYAALLDLELAKHGVSSRMLDDITTRPDGGLIREPRSISTVIAVAQVVMPRGSVRVLRCKHIRYGNVRMIPNSGARSACQGGRGRPTPMRGDRAMDARCQPCVPAAIRRHALGSSTRLRVERQSGHYVRVHGIPRQATGCSTTREGRWVVSSGHGRSAEVVILDVGEQAGGGGEPDVVVEDGCHLDDVQDVFVAIANLP